MDITLNLNLYKTPHGSFYSLPNDIVFVTHLRNGSVFEEDFILKTILPTIKKHKPKENHILLDIGGHIGSHSILYSQYMPSSSILTFEPQSALYAILNKNIEINRATNIQTFNKAVGHKNCACHMADTLYDGYNLKIDYEKTNQPFNYGGMTIGSGGEPVEMVRIDDLNLNGCDYMKMDVEGCESLVLLGAMETIRKHKPVIMFEYSDKHLNEHITKELNVFSWATETPLEILKEEGYRIQSFPECNYIATHIGSE